MHCSTQGCDDTGSSLIISLWLRSLATEHSSKLTILGYFASNNEHCFGISKLRIFPGRINSATGARYRYQSQSKYTELTSLTLCAGIDYVEWENYYRSHSSRCFIIHRDIQGAHAHGDVVRSRHVPVHDGQRRKFTRHTRETDDTFATLWM